MLNTQDKILIEQRITNEKPSVGVAYLLLLVLWPFGAHRFYLGRVGSAVVMLLLSLTVVGLVLTALWAFIDLFLIPGIIQEKVEDIRQRLTTEAMANGGSSPAGSTPR